MQLSTSQIPTKPVNSQFPWVRHWRVTRPGDSVAQAASASDPAEDEFLYLPKNQYAELEIELPTHLHTLADLITYPALILLGRPGAGKSTELDLARESGLFEKDGCTLVYRRAKSFEAGTADALIADVQQAQVSGKPIRLVLDGADEVLMSNPRFLNRFEEYLETRRKQRDLPELKLIIACRAAEWPEGNLANLWPVDQFIVAQLCQLDSVSAHTFVSDHLGAHSDAFWKEVYALRIHFLAIWPHSLASLVEEFRENDGRLPGTLFDLVDRTARRRSDVNHSETDPQRRRRLREYDVPIEWSYRLVSRAAALGCFSGRPMLGIRPEPSLAAVISSEDYLVGAEPMKDSSVRPLDAADLDTLSRTAIFDILAGGNRVAFNHQLIREFLAASWLADRGLPLAQLISLFGSYREDGLWRHFPQLSAIAAWLASNPASKDWRQFLIVNDPSVLLRADAAGLSDVEKIEIARALLECAARERAIDSGWQHRHLRSLACTGLAEVVHPYLLNFSIEAEASRQLAIELVRECRIQDCAPDLWQAIERSDVSLRPLTAYALFEIDKESDKWRDVLDEIIPLDREGALLGAALSILVPSTLKVRDVLPQLVPKRDFGFMNGLYIDAHESMPQWIEDADVIPIVRHSAKHHGLGFNKSWNREEASILSEALRRLASRLDEQDVMQDFVEWWWANILRQQHHPLDWDHSPVKLSELGFDIPKRRRAFLECAVRHPALSYIKGKDSFWTYFDVLVLLPQDVSWLVEQIEHAQPREEMIYAQWLNPAFYQYRGDAAIRDALSAVYQKSGVVKGTLPAIQEGKSILEELDLRQKARRQKDEERTSEFLAKMAIREDETKQYLAELLNQAQEKLSQGDWRAWQFIEGAFFYQRHPGGGPIELEVVDDIKAEGKDWMLETARLWLKHQPDSFPVENQNIALDLQISSARALYAIWDLIDEDKEARESIRSGWLPHIFCALLRFSWNSGDFTLQNCIRRFLPESATALMAVIRADYTTSGDSWAVRELDLVAPHVLQPLRQMLLEVPPKSNGFPNAIRWLARHDLASAEEVVHYWLTTREGDEIGEADIAVMTAILLHLEGRFWPDIKARLIDQRQIAAKVLHEAFYRIGLAFNEQMDLSRWPSDYLADIAELMIRTFPPKGNRYQNDDVDDSTHQARDSLISELGNRGMTAEIARLESLRIEGTERWLRQVYLRATKASQVSRWEPIAPKALLAIAGDHEIRFVRTKEDLMRVTLAALGRYQLALQRSVLGRDLRNDNDNTPVKEDRLSDRLAHWLRENLKILSLREVKTVHDKREDVTIVVAPIGKEPIVLTIEVKKNNSSLLLEKMETQLKTLYLIRQNQTHGIYLVYWFEDASHSAHPTIRTLEDIRAYLTNQATDLSEVPYSIECLVFDCRSETILPPDPHRKQPKKPSAKKSK